MSTSTFCNFCERTLNETNCSIVAFAASSICKNCYNRAKTFFKDNDTASNEGHIVRRQIDIIQGFEKENQEMSDKIYELKMDNRFLISSFRKLIENEYIYADDIDQHVVRIIDKYARERGLPREKLKPVEVELTLQSKKKRLVVDVLDGPVKNKPKSKSYSESYSISKSVKKDDNDEYFEMIENSDDWIHTTW